MTTFKHLTSIITYFLLLPSSFQSDDSIYVFLRILYHRGYSLYYAICHSITFQYSVIFATVLTRLAREKQTLTTIRGDTRIPQYFQNSDLSCFIFVEKKKTGREKRKIKTALSHRRREREESEKENFVSFPLLIVLQPLVGSRRSWEWESSVVIASLFFIITARPSLERTEEF